VFPYHVAHLGLSFETWTTAALQKWPLATLGFSRRTHHVMVMADSDCKRSIGNIVIESIPAAFSGPRYCSWGADWSWEFEKRLRLISNSTVFVHLNDYYSSNMTTWCLQGRGNLIVSVLHGMGCNVSDCQHVSCTICLRTEHWARIRGAGHHAKLVNPSIDTRFTPYPEISRERRICFVSTIIPYKGTDTVISTVDYMMKHNQAFHLDILGTGRPEDLHKFENQLKEVFSAANSCTYTMHGHVPMETISHVLAKASLMLHPSITEGFSIAVTEALATGCPVVGLQGVHDERLSEQDGLFCVSADKYPAKVLDVFTRTSLKTSFSPTYHHDGVVTFDADYSVTDESLRIQKPPYSTRIKSMKVLVPIKKLWRRLKYGQEQE
jgi:glycosyltransferase involved in cell wall biosynthesis